VKYNGCQKFIFSLSGRSSSGESRLVPESCFYARSSTFNDVVPECDFYSDVAPFTSV
jgi:hypothetical protein